MSKVSLSNFPFSKSHTKRETSLVKILTISELNSVNIQPCTKMKNFDKMILSFQVVKKGFGLSFVRPHQPKHLHLHLAFQKPPTQQTYTHTHTHTHTHTQPAANQYQYTHKCSHKPLRLSTK